MARVVVTGIEGFIGSHLAKRLLEFGDEVIGIMRPCASRSLEPIKDVLDNVVLLTGDITDLYSVSTALKTANPDYVCHLAALTPVRLSFERPFDYERTNYLAVMNVVHAMMDLPDHKRRKLIFASTPEVYGLHNDGKPLKEDACLRPISPYAVSKAAADMYIRMACRVYGLNAVILRPANTYGRKFERGFLVEYLVTSMLKNEKVCVGAPESVREYMYVSDHVNGYLQAMKSGRSGEVYNLGTGKGLRNRDLVEKIAEKMGYDKKKVVFDAYPRNYPLRPIVSDQPYIVLDSGKAKREMEWVAEVDIDDGLDKTIDYWRSRLTA